MTDQTQSFDPESVSAAALRERFLDYFRRNGHTVVPSSPLVPANDPTLLFTNAGMVQFKDTFLGREQRGYVRAASSQRCVRAGGKHNDLENVGYTARHHTFFEMLGNFSFGDYFKREAIHYAWELLTQVYGLAPERLWVTVFTEDDEAAAIWLEEVGVDPQRFSRIGAKDNFWSMGETGPCGPCTEIFYDHGPEVWGGPPGTPDEDGDRYIEIWNLVFMQYDRLADGTLEPLPRPSVDTGMGLERLAAVLQGVHSNYETDLFQPLIRVMAELAGQGAADHPSLKVIADHIRSCSFLITDGVLPSNEGRGYVLRRIIRRAARHGHKLGLDEPFFHRLVAPLVDNMGAAYPELAKNAERVATVLQQEEQRFNETLEQGLGILEADIARMTGRTIPGSTLFKLYDTYGFPVDLTADIARERELEVDFDGFEQAMAEQRERSKGSSHFAADYQIKSTVESVFTGYDVLTDQATVAALFVDGRAVDAIEAGQAAVVILDETPFYAESGGQVGDRGVLRHAGAHFVVDDTRKQGDSTAHYGRVESGHLKVGETVTAAVDAERRRATMRNHSATHLLHAALREILGVHVEQKGSLVAPDRLRFDFSHPQPVDRTTLARLERRVNEEVRANHPGEVRVMPYDEAIASGAVALFGEKYGDEVRVLRFGEYSVELCGGTHVARTGDIGLFKIVSEGGVSSGIRRIEALTGEAAFTWVTEMDALLNQLSEFVKGPRDELGERTRQILERNRALERELGELKQRLATQAGGDLADRAVEANGARLLVERLDGADSKALRSTVDQLKNRLAPVAVLLATVDGEKVRLVAGVTKDLTPRVKAGELVNEAARHVGGRGGGRPDLAEAGGNAPEDLDNALEHARTWLREQLAATSVT